MFFIIEKSEETTFNFSQNSVTIIQIMETQKIVNLLNDSNNKNSKFATKKWYIIDIETKGDNEIKFLISSLESSLCDFADAHVLVTENITVTVNNKYIRERLDASFQEVSRLFVLVYARGDDVTNEIDGRNFYDESIDDLIKQYDEVRKITGQGGDYTTGCLLDFAYFKKKITD